jgi:hypothetical protein
VSLASAPRNLFAVWAPSYLRSLVHRSLALPAVSAFYRLISLGLHLSQDYWGHQLLRSGINQEEKEEVDVNAVAPLLRRYLQHVCVALERFSDELLCAALKMVVGKMQPFNLLNRFPFSCIKI